MSDITRRQFLQVFALTAGAMVLPPAGGAEAADEHPPPILHTAGASVSPSICPYCAVGCGLRVYIRDGQAIHIEGDPDHPINEGALCSKGAASLQLIDNDLRLTHVLYRPPNGTHWEQKPWSWALEQVARRIKSTRDATFEERSANGQLVNRTPAIAHLGGAAHTNEECYLLVKMMRALGLVYLEHQARI